MHQFLWMIFFFSAAFVVVLAGALYRITLKCHQLKSLVDGLSHASAPFRLAASLAHIGVWTWNIETHRLSPSDELFAIYGLTKEDEVCFSVFTDRIHPDDKKRVIDSLEAAIIERDVFESEFRIIRMDGTTRHLKAHGSIQRDGANKALLMIGVNIDRTKEIETADRLLMITEELSRKNRSLSLAAKSGHIGIWTWNVVTNDMVWNDQMYEMYGIPSDTTNIYETWRRSIHPADRMRAEELLQGSVTNQTTYDTEFRVILKNGDIRYIKADSDIKQNSQGHSVVVTGTNIDITKQKEAMHRLALEKDKLNNILLVTNIGIFEWDIRLDRLECNEIWANMLGYQLSELRPISSDIWIKLAHPEDSKIVMQLKEHPFTKENPFYDSEFRMLHKNGQWIWVHVIGKVTMWSDGNLPSLMFGTQQEITLRKNLEKKVYYQANFDSLTGLASRTLAEERLKLTLEIAVRSKHTVGVLFMDLNGLKDINDTLGHDAGDFLIQEAARRIKSCTRATDTVSRFGGDEYLVILSDIKSKKNAEMVAHNIIKAMEEVIMIQDHFFKVGVSIGISLFPDCTLDRKKLIHFADQAMYLIKKTGKSGYLVAS